MTRRQQHKLEIILWWPTAIGIAWILAEVITG